MLVVIAAVVFVMLVLTQQGARHVERTRRSQAGLCRHRRRLVVAARSAGSRRRAIGSSPARTAIVRVSASRRWWCLFFSRFRGGVAGDRFRWAIMDGQLDGLELVQVSL